ncbi:MAG: XisI protein [Oscillatoria sp. PMC 1068.18]|nr:XisI protein [Oscillatoria sp. PMC 1076.18]MEC4990269.1 XisI protein [Oscillatoria sp. PMC 1068.18]
MDNLDNYRKIIQNKLKEYTEIPYAYGDLRCQLIVSDDQNNFLLITQGWEEDLHVHGCLVHLEIIQDKIWIHRDGIEDGIANELVAAEIPKSQIVLGFHPPDVRPFTEFAVS